MLNKVLEAAEDAGFNLEVVNLVSSLIPGQWGLIVFDHYGEADLGFLLDEDNLAGGVTKKAWKEHIANAYPELACVITRSALEAPDLYLMLREGLARDTELSSSEIDRFIELFKITVSYERFYYQEKSEFKGSRGVSFLEIDKSAIDLEVMESSLAEMGERFKCISLDKYHRPVTALGIKVLASEERDLNAGLSDVLKVQSVLEPYPSSFFLANSKDEVSYFRTREEAIASLPSGALEGKNYALTSIAGFNFVSSAESLSDYSSYEGPVPQLGPFTTVEIAGPGIWKFEKPETVKLTLNYKVFVLLLDEDRFFPVFLAGKHHLWLKLQDLHCKVPFRILQIDSSYLIIGFCTSQKRELFMPILESVGIETASLSDDGMTCRIFVGLKKRSC